MLNGVMRGLLLVSMCVLICVGTTNAQSGSIYFAGGTATDSSAGPTNTLGGGTVYNTPRLGGFFETFGGDVIFWHGLGVGGEFSFRKDQSAYAGLSYRPEFYDANVVYQPRRFSRRFVPEFEGGLGRVSLRYYDTPQFCQTFFLGCQSPNALVSKVNYWQVHFSGGVRYYFYKSVFVRPQVDIRYAPDMVDFGSRVASAFSVAIGYTFTRGRKGR